MSFAKHIFSTTSSLASIEKGINVLAGTKKVNSILGDGTTTKVKVSDDVSYAIFLDNEYISTISSAINNEIIIPVKNVTYCTTYDIDDVALATYSFSYGYGSYGYAIDDITNKITIINPEWELVSELGSWNDKITIAKTKIGAILKNYLKTDFSNNGLYNYYDLNKYAVTYNTDILDLINNLDIFNLASDYLVLSMCFTDLAQGGNNSQYQAKADRYHASYQKMMDDNIKLVDIDLDQDGQTDIQFYDSTNRIII